MPADARTLDEVIDRLGDVIERAIRERSRLGFFAALYRKVTVEVKHGIAAGRFDDGARMERLDVTFANRYLDALERFRRGAPPAASWRVSFEAAPAWRPIILQHLLLGVNAHINYDLGIAAAETCPGDALGPLQRDFDQINAILRGMIDGVQTEIGRVSPWIRLLDRVGHDGDERLVNFSLGKARACAWGVAQRLAPARRDDWGSTLEPLDRQIAGLGHLVRRPIGKAVNLGLMLIRSREESDVATIIRVLDEAPPGRVTP